MCLLIHAGIKVKHVSKRGPRWQCVLPCILLYLHAFIPCLNKSCLILSRSEPLSIVSYRHGRKWPMENQYHIDDSSVIWASHRFGNDSYDWWHYHHVSAEYITSILVSLNVSTSIYATITLIMTCATTRQDLRWHVEIVIDITVS